MQLPIAVTLSAPHPLRPPLPAITDSLQLIYFSVYNPKFSTISERRKWHSGLLTLWSGGCSPLALPGTVPTRSAFTSCVPDEIFIKKMNLDWCPIQAMGTFLVMVQSFIDYIVIET